jgi:GDPmannose 4,6-dehydratase
VLATGETHSVREFVEQAFACMGIHIRWEGTGVDEKGYDSNGRLRVSVNSDFYRPCEVDLLVGDASKAYTTFGWKPRISFQEIVRRMVTYDGLFLNETKNLHTS